MTHPADDRLDRAARLLATGDDDPALDAAERRHLGRLRLRLADEATWAQPPPELVDRIVALIDGDGSGRDVPPAHSARSRRGPGRGRRWRPALGGMAVAAALVLVLGGLALVRRPDESPATPIVEVALAGTDLAPGARADATVEDTGSGLAIGLDLRGVPPAPDDSFYQAWMKGPAGSVPIGTFHLRGGDEPVELWSGVTLARYPVLTVTLEPEDGDPASSGQVVLTSAPAPPTPPPGSAPSSAPG